ncbi:hypothetical protein VNO77_16671 [Canavalia gladiata]|uniref:Uncharacterized protein n=1 Tax=Canavalia gladiata TaxID=3824 RepID=A0AAN9QLX6_CANGL
MLMANCRVVILEADFQSFWEMSVLADRRVALVFFQRDERLCQNAKSCGLGEPAFGAGEQSKLHYKLYLLFFFHQFSVMMNFGVVDYSKIVYKTARILD